MRKSGSPAMKSDKNSARLRQIVESFPRLTVAVLADLVADEFVFGEISRVSREAPVLILKHRERTVLPGGGANAINNLADLGATVLPVGVLGEDDAGDALLGIFRRKRIALDGIVRDKNYRTVTKTRILAGMTHTSRQQVVRIDHEPEGDPSPQAKRKLAQVAQKYLGRSQALLVSDYGYGTATPQSVANLRRTTKVPVILDSRYRLLQYSGVTAATPNEPEVEAALNIEIGNDWTKLRGAAKEVMGQMKLDSLLITRGRDGMVALTRGKEMVDLPIYGSDQVVDVTGAGDTVIATFTAALAAGADAVEAAHLANYAGGIVVMKRGTATVTRTELLHALESSAPATRKH
jgi:rfaE bifunctional protein kinase chain/domain